MRRAFSLIEILIVVSIIAVLLAIITPALRSARTAARSAVCASNLRQSYLACADYAHRHGGEGPTIGVPWGDPPNWGLIVRDHAAHSRAAASESYDNDSVLVCPLVDDAYTQDMTRTYAMNATGHAGAPGDPDDFDTEPAHIRFDLVSRPTDSPLLLDSRIAWIPGDSPPPTRSSSVIDFRNQSHVDARIGRFHPGGRFNVAYFDGSVRIASEPDSYWETPLP